MPGRCSLPCPVEVSLLFGGCLSASPKQGPFQGKRLVGTIELHVCNGFRITLERWSPFRLPHCTVISRHDVNRGRRRICSLAYGFQSVPVQPLLSASGGPGRVAPGDAVSRETWSGECPLVRECPLARPAGGTVLVLPTLVPPTRQSSRDAAGVKAQGRATFNGKLNTIWDRLGKRTLGRADKGTEA